MVILVFRVTIYDSKRNLILNSKTYRIFRVLEKYLNVKKLWCSVCITKFPNILVSFDLSPVHNYSRHLSPNR